MPFSQLFSICNTILLTFSHLVVCMLHVLILPIISSRPLCSTFVSSCSVGGQRLLSHLSNPRNHAAHLCPLLNRYRLAHNPMPLVLPPCARAARQSNSLLLPFQRVHAWLYTMLILLNSTHMFPALPFRVQAKVSLLHAPSTATITMTRLLESTMVGNTSLMKTFPLQDFSPTMPSNLAV